MNQKEPYAIPCDTCQDLIPLVLDGAASESSRRLVEEHVAQCDACRAFYGEGAPVPEPDDAKVLGRVRRRIWLWLFTLAGLMLCAVLMDGGPQQGRFVILALPALGALSRLWGGKRWYLLPGCMGAFGFVWVLWHWLPDIAAGRTAWRWSMLTYAASACMEAAVLGLLGAAAAVLLRYAFAKEDKP